MFNRLGLHPTWQWLPQTQVYADVSEGIVTGIGSADTPALNKVTSYPLTAQLGLSTLLTIKTTFNLYAGYTNGFYSAGPSFSAPMLGAQIGYRYSPMGRIALLYSLQYEDSINANYYRDHIIQLSEQQVYGPVTFVVQPEVHFREYDGITLVDGPPTRDDVIFAVVAGAQYNFRNRIAATLDYRFTDVSTDYRYMPLGGGTLTDPSYVRHEVLLGLRVAM
jgi:opacity protein-like surface antigen